MNSSGKNWLRLHFTRGLGRVGILRLMKAFSTVEAILDADAGAWAERAGIKTSVAKGLPKEDDPTFERVLEKLEKLGVSIVTLWDEERYPALLKQIHDPPVVLYVRGHLPAQDALAVVGSRRASVSGRRLTKEICAELAEREITVVSGLARGIDTAAHEGALNGGGLTVGVLGCGIDHVYPPENAKLFDHVVEQGAVVSEYPPGTRPLAGHFPGRNRIISGLCKGVLVVEAAQGSGSLITVDFALEQGREVFAVPGSVYAPSSRGVNSLLKDGAHVVTEGRDILDVLWPQRPQGQVRQKEDAFAFSLSGDALCVYQNLSEEPLHVDELAHKSGLTPMDVSAILLHLELQGGIQQLPGMRYIRSGRC